MMPINKSLTLEKSEGAASREDEMNEAVMLTQILHKLQMSDAKVNKALGSLVRGQRSILDSMEGEDHPPAV